MIFPSIRIEGQIFSGELLQRLDQPDLAGQKPADFGLPPDAKVKEEIASAWADAQSYYRAFRQRVGKKEVGGSQGANTDEAHAFPGGGVAAGASPDGTAPAAGSAAGRAASATPGAGAGSAPARVLGAAPLTFTSETRNLWLIPFLALLGYKPEFSRKGDEVNGKTYPISHRDEARDGLPIHILGWNDSLDKRRDDGSGPRMSAHALLQEYLNLTEHLYGLVSNGRTLRLLRDSTRLVRQSFIEFDLERMFDEDLFADFAVLFRLLHATRLPISQATAPASLVEKYHQDALDQGARIRDGLRDAVEQTLVLLGTGFLSHPANDALRSRLGGGEPSAEALSPRDYYHHLLRLVYRLLFLLVAEERSLIFPPTASPRQRNIYLHHYSVSRFRRLVERPFLFEKAHSDLWQALLTTFRLFEFDGPGAKLGLAPLGGHLFATETLGPLAKAALYNADLLQVIRTLCFFQRDGRQFSAVNYGALATEEFGSVYESLLELSPVITGTTFSFRQVAGNERKTTGSYYTPDSLVQCLLDSALDPVTVEAVKGLQGEDAARAILNLKVCDPACGSGHFLVAAAHRLARQLAKIRLGDAEPSPAAVRHALRDVIGHCLYGVDINPMAVELCRVSLWLEAMEPGRPLSFLDHHVQCGNSLLGTTPELIAQGIPDDAFKAIEGDDKKACTELRKRNKAECKEIGGLFVTEDQARAEALRSAIVAVDEMLDETPEAVQGKAAAFAAARTRYGYLSSKRLADTWCAAFVIQKRFPPSSIDPRFQLPEPFGITQRHIVDLAQGRALFAEIAGEVAQVVARYQFLHWHLAFPDVFAKGGFDCVLGNPPWERVKLQEMEFFAGRKPSIASAQNAAARKKLIAALPVADPELWEEWSTASREAQGQSHFARNSGRYPLCGQGDINVYALFAEHNWRVLAPRGRAGFIVPSGIATDDTTKDYFQAVTKSGALRSLWEFENEGFFSAGMGHMLRFALTTLSGKDAPASEADFLFQGHDIADLADPNRHFTLSAADIATINPNTGTCPIFQTKRDALVALAIYRRTGILWREGDPDGNPWGIRFLRMLDMANDSGLFRTRAELVSAGWRLDGSQFLKDEKVMLPLYEAKMAYIYNHRSGTFEEAASGERQHRLPTPSDQQLADPSYAPLPCYWVDQKEVDAKLEGVWDRGWLLGWRDVTDARASARTVVACVIPRAAVNDKFLLMLPSADARFVAILYCNLCCLPFDYCSRQKVGGISLKYFTMRQLPALPPSIYSKLAPWDSYMTTRDWLLPRVVELTYSAWDLQSFAEDCGDNGAPFVWDAERRFHVQCEIDAAFFLLYGIARDDADYILDTFPVLRRSDERTYGEFRTKRVVLELYDALAQATATGQRYVSTLPPPQRAQ